MFASCPFSRFKPQRAFALMAVAAVFGFGTASGMAPAVAAPLRLPAGNKPVRVACIGDSITAGVGASRGEANYPSLLGAMLGSRFRIGNFGESGATLLKNGDSPYWQRGNLAASDAFAPDVVIVMLGTNDSKPQNWKNKDQFAADYAALLEHYAALPSKPQLFVCLPPTVARQGNYGIAEGPVEEEIPSIRQVAAAKGATVIDVHGEVGGDPGLFVDNVHPNDRGYVRLASVVFQGLTRAPVILPPGGTKFLGSVVATVAAPAPGVVVRYTQNGSDPTPASPAVTGPITLRRAVTLKTRAFVGKKPFGMKSAATFTPTLDLAFQRPYAVSDPNRYGWGLGGLTDGSWEANSAHCFASGEKDEFPKTATIDLGTAQRVSAVALGVPPFGATRTVSVSLSVDGAHWKPVGSHVFDHKAEERYTITFPAAQARYVRLTYPDHDPDGAGYAPTFVFTTECEVYAKPPSPTHP